jgi:hypothetical protein
MSCPSELSPVLLDIIRIGLLKIRHFGELGMSGRCTVEADHIHNLPELLSDYSPELLVFYWTVERTSYADQSSEDDLRQFSGAWDRVERYIAHNCLLPT